ERVLDGDAILPNEPTKFLQEHERARVRRSRASRTDGLRRNRQVQAHNAVLIEADPIGPLDLSGNQGHRYQQEAPCALRMLDRPGLVRQSYADWHKGDAPRMLCLQLVREFPLPAVRHAADAPAQQDNMAIACA